MDNKNTESPASRSLQLLFVGFNRSITYVYPSIRQNIIDSCSRQGFKVRLSAVITTAEKIVESDRVAREYGRVKRALPPELISDANDLLVFDEESVNAETHETFERVKRFGDPWPETRFKSLFNLVHLLFLQREAANLIDFESNIVMFLRSDLLPLDTLDLDKIEKLVANHLVTPSWHHWGYLNDRVALSSPWVMRQYLGRWDQMFNYLKSVKEPLHAEKFLSFAMRDTQSAQVLTERFARVRADGNVLQEVFTSENQTFWSI